MIKKLYGYACPECGALYNSENTDRDEQQRLYREASSCCLRDLDPDVWFECGCGFVWDNVRSAENCSRCFSEKDKEAWAKVIAAEQQLPTERDIDKKQELCKLIQAQLKILKKKT